VHQLNACVAVAAVAAVAGEIDSTEDRRTEMSSVIILVDFWMMKLNIFCINI
jgi:hypothetical protein